MIYGLGSPQSLPFLEAPRTRVEFCPQVASGKEKEGAPAVEASNIGSLPAAPDPLLLSKSWQSWTQMIGAQVGTQGPRQSPSGTMNFK